MVDCIPIDLAYLAGYFDGEGCVRIKKTKRNQHHVLVQITNRDLPMLEYVKDIFGGSVCLNRHNNKNANRCYTWQTTHGKAYKFLKTIYPYLRGKKEQARLAIEFRDRRKGQKYRGNTHEVPVVELAIREGYAQTISDLKEINYG